LLDTQATAIKTQRQKINGNYTKTLKTTFKTDTATNADCPKSKFTEIILRF
jgi:hypothetical protein